jgi:hypothetical protein
VLIKKALYAPGVKKVVLILHSQGGIEGSMILDWLLAEVPGDLLQQLEIYTFGNAANHFNNPYRDHRSYVAAFSKSRTEGEYVQAARNRAIGHLEHYANTKDFVSLWGVLNFTQKKLENAREDRFSGRVFERPGSGHQFNQHYLDNMFPLDKTRRVVREPKDGDFMDMEVEIRGDTSSTGVREELDESLYATTGSMEEASKKLSVRRTPDWTKGQRKIFDAIIVDGDPEPVVKVGDLSRLWQYRNGNSPPDWR